MFQSLGLTPPPAFDELTALTAYLVQRDNARWDEQISRDAESGKLDFLFEEAREERANGRLRDWPE